MTIGTVLLRNGLSETQLNTLRPVTLIDTRVLSCVSLFLTSVSCSINRNTTHLWP